MAWQLPSRAKSRGWNTGSRRSLNALLAPTLPAPAPAQPDKKRATARGQRLRRAWARLLWASGESLSSPLVSDSDLAVRRGGWWFL